MGLPRQVGGMWTLSIHGFCTRQDGPSWQRSPKKGEARRLVGVMVGVKGEGGKPA